MSSRKWFPAIGAYIKFHVVGVINTLVDVAVFTLLIWAGSSAIIAQCIAYSCGATNSFVWNKHWTFRSRRRFSVTQLLQFLTVNAVSLAVSLAVISVLQQHYALLISKIVATFLAMAVNFAGNRIWVFRDENA